MFTAGKYLWGMEEWSGVTEEYSMAHGKMDNLSKLSHGFQLRYELAYL